MRLRRDAVSGIYHAVFRDADGHQHQRTTKSKSLAEARIIVGQSHLREIEISAHAGNLTAEALTAIMAGGKVSCEEAGAEWSAWRRKHVSPNTVRTQEIIMRQFLAMNGAVKWPVNKLTYDHLDRFVNANDDTGVSNRNLRLATVRSFFDFLTARAYCVGNPARLVRVRLNGLMHEQKEKRSRVPISEAEFRHILQHTHGIWRWWTALGYWTGLRLTDCACLEWASVLPDELVVWTRKGESRVALPIQNTLIGGGELRVTFLEMLECSNHEPFVFPLERAIALDPSRRARHSVYYARILRSLGIEGKSFHCLRHAFATRLAVAGKTIDEIGRLLGHGPNSARVTETYIHT